MRMLPSRSLHKDFHCSEMLAHGLSLGWLRFVESNVVQKLEKYQMFKISFWYHRSSARGSSNAIWWQNHAPIVILDWRTYLIYLKSKVRWAMVSCIVPRWSNIVDNRIRRRKGFWNGRQVYDSCATLNPCYLWWYNLTKDVPKNTLHENRIAVSILPSCMAQTCLHL